MSDRTWEPRIVGNESKKETEKSAAEDSALSDEDKIKQFMERHPRLTNMILSGELLPSSPLYIAYAGRGTFGTAVDVPDGSLKLREAAEIALVLDALHMQLVTQVQDNKVPL